MTWLPTHIALESFLIWIGMGKKNREIFRERRGLFTLLALTAALPDLDTLFYIHRTYFHSFVWPVMLILGVLFWYSYRLLRRKNSSAEKELDLVSRCLIISGVFVILHIILDLDPGPVLLFFPFDNRMYSLNVSMLWDLDAWYILGGFKINWTSVSFNEGLNSYFLNLTPRERIEYFGTEFLKFPVGEFPIHGLLFLAWLYFFPMLSLIAKLQNYSRPQAFFRKLKEFKKPLLSGGVVLLSFGIFLGPVFNLHRVEKRESTSWFAFSQEGANFALIRNFELDRGDAISLSGLFSGNNSRCEIGAAIADQERVASLTTSLAALFEQYNKQPSLTYEWLTASYQSIIQEFLSGSLRYSFLSPNSSQELSFTLEQSMPVSTVIILADWNINVDFQVEVLAVSSLLIQRPLEFYFGLSLAIIGIIMITIPVVLVGYNLKKSALTITDNEEEHHHHNTAEKEGEIERTVLSEK